MYDVNSFFLFKCIKIIFCNLRQKKRDTNWRFLCKKIIFKFFVNTAFWGFFCENRLFCINKDPPHCEEVFQFRAYTTHKRVATQTFLREEGGPPRGGRSPRVRNFISRISRRIATTFLQSRTLPQSRQAVPAPSRREPFTQEHSALTFQFLFSHQHILYRTTPIWRGFSVYKKGAAPTSRALLARWRLRRPFVLFLPSFYTETGSERERSRRK